MNCRNIRDKLILFAGGDLEALEAAEVDVHTRQCLACYRELASLREMVQRVRGLRDQGPSLLELAPDEEFTAAVMARIDGLPEIPRRRLPQLLRYSGWAAALVLGLFLGAYSDGFWMGSPSGRPVDDPRRPGGALVDATPAMDPVRSGLSPHGLRLVDETIEPLPESLDVLEALRRLQLEGPFRPQSQPVGFTQRDF